MTKQKKTKTHSPINFMWVHSAMTLLTIQEKGYNRLLTFVTIIT